MFYTTAELGPAPQPTYGKLPVVRSSEFARRHVTLWVGLYRKCHDSLVNNSLHEPLPASRLTFMLTVLVWVHCVYLLSIFSNAWAAFKEVSYSPPLPKEQRPAARENETCQFIPRHRPAILRWPLIRLRWKHGRDHIWNLLHAGCVGQLSKRHERGNGSEWTRITAVKQEWNV
jgi:hypothetical protein